MTAIAGSRTAWAWRCLHCRGPLTAGAQELRCADCDRSYPVAAELPILVREPGRYLRSELASLVQTLHEAQQRGEMLDRTGRDAGLPEASLARHHDVMNAEIARTEAFLVLLEPAAQALGDDAAEPAGPGSAGWASDDLVPYLLRDWTETAELAAVRTRINAALNNAFPDPSGRSVVFAGCGAGGLPAGISPGFERVLGFDLTLPVLTAARRLLDGDRLELPLPRAIGPAGRVTLRGRDRCAAGPRIELAAMDAFDTALPDGSVDCVVTSFLLDLIPEPLNLAAEVHRILSDDGVWINYGPSGPLKAFWRFDTAETTDFLKVAGFSPIEAASHRTTYMDLSRECPAWSFRSHICYLTSARKAGPGRARPIVTTPGRAVLARLVPRHFPGACLIERQSLGAQPMRTTLLRHEAVPGRETRRPVSDDTARIMRLVDGTRTVSEIAVLLQPQQPDVIGAFARCFRQGLLSWEDG